MSEQDVTRAPVRRDIGKVGVWSGQFDFSPAGVVRAAIAELDAGAD